MRLTHTKIRIRVQLNWGLTTMLILSHLATPLNVTHCAMMIMEKVLGLFARACTHAYMESSNCQEQTMHENWSTHVQDYQYEEEAKDKPAVTKSTLFSLFT